MARNVSVIIFLFITTSIIAVACTSGHSEQSAATPDAPKTGKEIFQNNCVVCHGDDGKKGLAGASDLTISKLRLVDITDVATNGRQTMVGFKAVLSAEELKTVSTYVKSLQES